MAAQTKSHDTTIRIETAGFGDLVPPFGASLDELPATFWATFAQALAASSSEEVLDPDERLLLEAAADVAYECGREIPSSWPWSPYVTPLDSADSTTEDVLHGVVATLAALGFDRCRVVELVPFERLVLRVPMAGGSRPQGRGSRHWPVPGRSATRAEELRVRGFCTGLMELAYGRSRDALGRREGAFKCRRTAAADLGEGAEFIVSRGER